MNNSLYGLSMYSSLHNAGYYANVYCSVLRCSNAEMSLFRRYGLTLKGTFGNVIESSRSGI